MLISGVWASSRRTSEIPPVKGPVRVNSGSWASWIGKCSEAWRCLFKGPTIWICLQSFNNSFVHYCVILCYFNKLLHFARRNQCVCGLCTVTPDLIGVGIIEPHRANSTSVRVPRKELINPEVVEWLEHQTAEQEDSGPNPCIQILPKATGYCASIIHKQRCHIRGIKTWVSVASQMDMCPTKIKTFSSLMHWYHESPLLLLSGTFRVSTPT